MSHIFTTPKGEKMVIVPLEEYNALQDALDGEMSRRMMTEISSGKQETLTSEEVSAALKEPTPLAFWRKKRKLTQKALADLVGVAQSYIANLEAGERKGDPALFLRLARALRVDVEDLILEV